MKQKKYFSNVVVSFNMKRRFWNERVITNVEGTNSFYSTTPEERYNFLTKQARQLIMNNLNIKLDMTNSAIVSYYIEEIK